MIFQIQAGALRLSVLKKSKPQHRDCQCQSKAVMLERSPNIGLVVVIFDCRPFMNRDWIWIDTGIMPKIWNSIIIIVSK